MDNKLLIRILLKSKILIDRYNLFISNVKKGEIIKIIRILGNTGMKKINLVGGEPTLCPFLGELLSEVYDIFKIKNWKKLAGKIFLK